MSQRKEPRLQFEVDITHDTRQNPTGAVSKTEKQVLEGLNYRDEFVDEVDVETGSMKGNVTLVLTADRLDDDRVGSLPTDVAMELERAGYAKRIHPDDWSIELIEHVIEEVPEDVDACDSHTWRYGKCSGIDLCRNCPAKRISGGPIQYTQSKPYGSG